MIDKRSLLPCLALLAAVSFVPNVHAANYYVWCGAKGDGSGLSWTNAMTNFKASNGKAALERGSTYYVAGDSSCHYAEGGLEFTTPQSGTQLITITKCTSAVPDCTSAAGWQSSFGTANAYFDSTSSDFIIRLDAGYYVINGSYCTQPGAPGSPGVATSCGFYMQSDTDFQPGSFFEVGPGTGASLQNVTIEYFGFDGVNCCDIPSTTTGTDFIWQFNDQVSNLLITHDVFTNSKQDFITVSTFSGVTITHNYFDTNRYTSTQHSSVIAINPSGTCGTCSCMASSNFSFGDNIVRNGIGTSLITVLNGTLQNADIYGDVFFHPNGEGGGRGTFSDNGTQSCITGTVHFLNNTIAGSINANVEGIYPLANGGSGGFYIENNLLWNTGPVVFPAGAHDDHNTYLNVSNNAGGYQPTTTDYWTTSGSAEPFANESTGDYRLLNETVDLHLNDGVDTNTILTANATDSLGTTRGQDGTWERGAYEFVTGAVPPSPPGSLTVTGIQ